MSVEINNKFWNNEFLTDDEIIKKLFWQPWIVKNIINDNLKMWIIKQK